MIGYGRIFMSQASPMHDVKHKLIEFAVQPGETFNICCEKVFICGNDAPLTMVYLSAGEQRARTRRWGQILSKTPCCSFPSASSTARRKSGPSRTSSPSVISTAVLAAEIASAEYEFEFGCVLKFG